MDPSEPSSLQVWVSGELREAIDRLVQAEHRTRSQMIRILLEEAIKARRAERA